MYQILCKVMCKNVNNFGVCRCWGRLQFFLLLYPLLSVLLDASLRRSVNPSWIVLLSLLLSTSLLLSGASDCSVWVLESFLSMPSSYDSVEQGEFVGWSVLRDDRPVL